MDDEFNEEINDEQIIEIPMEDTDDHLMDLWDEDDKQPNEQETSEETTIESETTEQEEVQDETENENPNEETEEIEIELDLVENHDEALVANIETLMLSEQMYLPDDYIKENFDGTKESYDKLLTDNKQAMNNVAIKSIYESLPDRGKDFFDYLINTNMQGDLDGWLDLERSEAALTDYDPKTLTDDQAKDVLKADLKSKGMKDKQIKFVLEGYEDDGDLIDEGKKVLNATYASAKEAKAAKLAADKQAIEEVKIKQQAFNKEVVSHINSTGFSTQKQEELYGMIYSNFEGSNNPILVDYISNIISNNPAHLVQLVQLFDGYTPEEGFNLKRLTSQIKSEVTKKTKKAIKRSTKKQIKGRTTAHDKNGKNSSIDEWLDGVEL